MTKRVNKKYISPIATGVGKGKFILNLNQYRNAHYRKTNNAKKRYKEFMKEQILKYKGNIEKALFIYTVYKGDKRSFDVGNVVSIHQKFFEDALVELGKMSDDKYSVVPMYIGCFGGIDADNPRVEVEVIDTKKDFSTKAISHISEIVRRLYGDN
jgi:hypothetical protein